MAGASKRRTQKARQDNQSSHASSNGGSARVQAVVSFDGPADSVSTRGTNQAVSQPGSTAQTEKTGPTGGGDAGRSIAPYINKRLELPHAAYGLFNSNDAATKLMHRPGFMKAGKEVTLALNSYNVLAKPSKNVFQYDVLIGKGDEKRGLIRAVWESKIAKGKIGGIGWLFDGNRLAWALSGPETELSFTVDLDQEKGITPRTGRSNVHRVVIRRTKKLDLGLIDAYLQGKMSFDNAVLEGINFLDHLLRQWPSSQYTTIKRCFYMRGQSRHTLGGGIEAFKGVYQSMRLVQGGKLSVNADVSNGTFWTEFRFHHTAQAICKCRDTGELMAKLRPIRDKENNLVESPAFRDLKRLRKLGVHARHRGAVNEEKMLIVDRVITKNADELIFTIKDKNKPDTTRELSVAKYFRERYDIMLEFPKLPLVAMTKKGTYYPMEILQLAPNQRYPFKLDENQTSGMIKFAVTKPEKRKQDIQSGLNMLKWDTDPFLMNYGLKISPNMVQTKARILPAPLVQFKGGNANPGTSGRWDLRGPKKFFLANTAPLKSWGILTFDRCFMDKEKVAHFAREFIKTYKSHGGTVTQPEPAVLVNAPLNMDPGAALQRIYQDTGNKNKITPQILMFILPNKDSFRYFSIKKSAECRFGIVTQCMQSTHAIKANGQYLSNVCMKFNAKLGGTTSRIGKAEYGHFKVPTVIIGADVSHPAPGSFSPSFAAVTLSLDKYAARYGAAVQTNGHRVEMITTDNLARLIMPLMGHYVNAVNSGKPPEHVYYFRDGVSEGQYSAVLKQEVADMKSMFSQKIPGWNPKFIVVVCSKRHNIRFFPRPGDRAGAGEDNPYPGVIVERDVTHPFENDVYLCSHRAIQGTARPAHYHVLINETKITNDELFTMIYEHCYQFCRATTPVSLHPAIYYAHIASNRGRAHEDIQSIQGPRSGVADGEKLPSEIGPDQGKDVEVPPLNQMNPSLGIKTSMWYV